MKELTAAERYSNLSPGKPIKREKFLRSAALLSG